MRTNTAVGPRTLSVTNHRDCGKKIPGDRGVRGGEVPLLWCSGSEYAACTITSSIRRAGEPAPAPGARALPHLHQCEYSSPSGYRSPLLLKHGFPHRYCIEARGLQDTTASEHRNKAILLDVTYAGVHMRTGSADRDGSAASTSETRKRKRYGRPGQVSFDKRSYKLATLAMESFGRLGKKGSDLIDQVATSIVGGTDGSSLARKGVCKERFFQIIYVTTHVAIWRRVNRYKLALRDRQAARGRKGEAGGLRPMIWGWNVDVDEDRPSP